MSVLNAVIAEPEKLTKRERTRRKLMTATRDLIYDRGIERVAILDITDAAGVAAGSFYNYFENKPAIVAAIVDDFHEVFEAHLSETRLTIKRSSHATIGFAQILFHGLSRQRSLAKFCDQRRPFR